jgi:hypothetical protein
LAGKQEDTDEKDEAVHEGETGDVARYLQHCRIE